MAPMTPATSRRSTAGYQADRPTKDRMERWVLLGAGAVIVTLTGLAFWLSYAHLAEVAGQHGLTASPARQWAWPATLDSFIVAGELLMLRAGLQGRTDRWAIGITAAGSLGSIALNVAGVPGARDPGAVPLLDYVVAAIPPAAALLAFGVLMRQVHGLVTKADVLVPATAPVIDDVSVPEDVRGPYPVEAPTAVLPAPAVYSAPEQQLFPAAPQVAAEDVPGARIQVLAAEESPRTRAVPVSLDKVVGVPEDVPEEVPTEEVPVPAGDAELVARARTEYADVLASGRTPAVRTLRTRFGIGQPKAQRVRDALVVA